MTDARFPRVVSLACHDVRTPLATVHGFVKTIERTVELAPPTDRYMEMIGAASAVIAVLPQLLQTHAALPLLSLVVTLAGVVIFGLAATWFATSLALRGNLLESLRSE